MYTLFHAGETVEVTYEAGSAIPWKFSRPTMKNRVVVTASMAQVYQIRSLKTLQYSVYEVKYWIQYTVGSPEKCF